MLSDAGGKTKGCLHKGLLGVEALLARVRTVSRAFLCRAVYMRAQLWGSLVAAYCAFAKASAVDLTTCREELVIVHEGHQRDRGAL